MSNNEIAFFVGLFGSMHCVGMCGPLAFAIPLNTRKYWILIWDKLIYNAGRVVSYSILGLATGLLGRRLWLSGLQQGVSLLSGVLIILAATSRLIKFQFKWGKFSYVLMPPFNKLIITALNKNAGHFVVGILNGFLPCGFVYLALVGSVNTDSVSSGVAYMFWFGIGTLPLMLAATIGSGFLNNMVKQRLNQLIPYFMLCLGIWFLLRGAQFDIPYLSPGKPNAGPSICH